MVDKKITELTELTTPDANDVVAIVDDPVGTPITKKITYANIESNIDHTNITAGDGSDHADVATNTLKDSSFWETKDATTNRFKAEKHIDMELRGIFGMINPTDAQGAATKDYVDNKFPVTHASTTGRTTDDHHAQSHNAASHSDITASGADIDDAVTKKHTAGTDPNDHASGSDDQDISGIATNATAIGLNTSHRGSAGGTDHSDVNTNNGKVSYTKTNVKGHIEHGATNDLTRPSGFTSVEWIGSVEPTTALNGDTWIDTS